MGDSVPAMRFEFRLIAVAALIFALVAIACRRESIAEVRRGLDGPPARCGRECGKNLKTRANEPPRIAAAKGAAGK